MKTKKLLPLIIMIVGLLGISSLGFAVPKYGGTSVIASSQDINMLDPHRTTSAVTNQILSLATQSLVEPDDNFAMKPCLAESWQIKENGKVWVFQLRKGVKFHNGREFTAEDVMFNMERIMDPKTGAKMASMFQDVDAVEALDKYTVRFKLKKPAGYFLAAHGGTVTRAPMIARECVNDDNKITHLIGTGAFEIVEWKMHDRIEFKKFDGYWEKGLPYLDNLTVKVVPDQTSRHLALRTGDVDWASFLSTQDVIKRMDGTPKGVVYSIGGAGFIGALHINITKPPLDDPRVRKAIAHCIDREELRIAWSYGQGVVVDQPQMPSSFWYCDLPELEKDIDKAKALLKEAGYPNGIDLEITYGKEYETISKAAETLEYQLKPAGIRVKLDPKAWSAYKEKASNSKHESFVTGWVVYSDPHLAYPHFYTPGGSYSFCYGSYSNPQVTKLLKQAGLESDKDKRKELYCKALKIVFTQDVPVIWFSNSPVPMGWRDYVKGWEQPVHESWNWATGGFKKVWLDK